MWTVAAAMLATSGAAALDKAAVKRAIDRGAGYLRTVVNEQDGGRAALCAYAILKSGAPPNDPAVANVIDDIVRRCAGEHYEAHRADSIYASGVEAMILADADAVRHLPHLQKIAAYLIATQRDDGSYTYRGPTSAGDVSVTQYAALGLWACARAGVQIPPQTWDRMAMWHLKSQMEDGGFQYNPGASTGVTGANANLTMTAAAAATMTIAAMHLHPRQSSIQDRRTVEALAQGPQPPRDANDPLGILTTKNSQPDDDSKPSGPYTPQASFPEIQQHVRAAVGWAGRNYTPEYRLDLRMYNYYTLERMGALTELEEIGGHNWFEDCGGRLLTTQAQDGSWTTSIYDNPQSYGVGTSFAVLFLTKSTAKLLNRVAPPDAIGGGMQAGGRGLPDDLSSVKLQDGRVAQELSMGPLDDLLKSLESAGSDDLFNLQKQIVKKIQLGDRSELIGQTDRLVKLLEYPSPDVRRTALWALARSDDLKMARHMVKALEDPDRDVLIEAHNALCWMSRRPNAFDIPDDPLAGLPPSATDEQKQAAVEKWRQLALQKWGQWYLRMSPYSERDDPFTLDLKRKIGVR